MKTLASTQCSIAWLALSGALFASQTQFQVTITELPLLPGGTYSSAYAINDTGKIVGVANDSTGTLHTVQWENGQISILPVYSGSAVSVPSDINDAGEISGTLAVGGQNAGIYWDTQPNAFPLPGLPGVVGSFVSARAINASGQIAGRAQEGGPTLAGHAVVWLANTFQTDLGFMGGGAYSDAYDINDAGAVVGVAGVANTNLHAFLWQNGQFTDLSTWSGAGPFTKAFGINNHGVIVGLNANVAAYWQNGAVHSLPMPAGISAFTPAIDINDAGDKIATGMKLFPNEVGVLWRNGTPIDLGTLPGGNISRARRINEAGVIVGEAQSASLYFRAVMWTVTEVPSTYCTAKTNSQGCVPSIASSGLPSASNASNFVVTASNVLNRQNGMFFYGYSQQVAPFQGGFMCMSNPIRRTPIQNSSGSASPVVDCSGAYVLDFNAWIQSGADLTLGVGRAVNGQFWSRDAASPSTTGLTNAIHFVIGS